MNLWTWMKPFTLNLEFSGNWAIFYFYCSLGKVLTKPRGFYCCSPAPPQSYFLFLCDLSLFVFGGFWWFFFPFLPILAPCSGFILWEELSWELFSMKPLEPGWQQDWKEEGWILLGHGLDFPPDFSTGTTQVCCSKSDKISERLQSLAGWRKAIPCKGSLTSQVMNYKL